MNAWRKSWRRIKVGEKFAWNRGGSKQVVMSRRESEKVAVKYGRGMKKVRKGTQTEIKKKVVELKLEGTLKRRP